MALVLHGGLEQDAGFGDGREDPAGVFCSGDRKRSRRFCRRAERFRGRLCRKGPALRGDGVSLRTGRSNHCHGLGRGRPHLMGCWRRTRGRPAPACELTLIRGIRGAARSWLRRRLRCGATVCARVGSAIGRRPRLVHSFRYKLCAGRGLSVRLEPRDRADQWHDGDSEGGACPALPQPDAICAGVSTRRRRRWCLTPTTRAFALFKGTCTRGILRQHEDGSGDDLRWSRASPTIVASCKCAAIISLIRWRAHLHQVGEKGQVENQVGLVRERFFTPRLRVRELRGARQRLAA